MTYNHKELCERLQKIARAVESFEIDNPDEIARRIRLVAATIASSAHREAARIQQQALEYASLQAQCAEHLARVSQLEILLDSERATNKALSDENAVLADQQPQELLARVAELDAACKMLERARESDPVCVKWYADQFDADQARIAELEKERDALKVDTERLDSGCIVTHERDEFGAEYECERRGVDLRARIDAAMEINKRQSERPDWAECESRGPLVRNSLKHRASELTMAANKCRRAYQKDFMRIPLEWLADAYDEAAAALNRRLSSIAALQAEKETR